MTWKLSYVSEPVGEVDGVPCVDTGLGWVGAASWIYWAGDDPTFDFLRPEDHPWLSPAEVEHINAPHRRAHLEWLATMLAVDWRRLQSVADNAELARRRLPIARARCTSPSQSFICLTGGWLPRVGDLPKLPPPFWSLIVAAVRLRQDARDAKDWPLADAIRRELAVGHIEVRDFPGGTEWIVVPPGAPMPEGMVP